MKIDLNPMNFGRGYTIPCRRADEEFINSYLYNSKVVLKTIFHEAYIISLVDHFEVKFFKPWIIDFSFLYNVKSNRYWNDKRKRWEQEIKVLGFSLYKVRIRKYPFDKPELFKSKYTFFGEECRITKARKT